jgi:hypothetical protein
MRKRVEGHMFLSYTWYLNISSIWNQTTDKIERMDGNCDLNNLVILFFLH